MKKIILYAVVFVLMSVGCSKDKDSGCESCTSDLGARLEICGNGDGSYTLKVDGQKTGTISESLLKEAGFSSPKEYIQRICKVSAEGFLGD